MEIKLIIPIQYKKKPPGKVNLYISKTKINLASNSIRKGNNIIIGNSFKTS